MIDLNKLLFCLIVFTVSFGFLHGESKLLDNLLNVQLKVAEKTNSSGNKYGFDYYAINQNSYPVYVSITTVSQNNVYESLVPGQFSINAGEEAYLGWIVQSNLSEDAKWELEWDVEVAPTSQISTK